MLVLTMRGSRDPSSSKGWRMASSRRWATTSGAPIDSPPSSRTTNSSPPTRPIVSTSRSAALHSRGDQHQQSVARFVAEGVVHVLEVVEVDEERRPVRVRCDGFASSCSIRSMMSVRLGKPGQHVVGRLEVELLGAIVDEPTKPGSVRAEHEDQHRDHEAECDATKEDADGVVVREEPAIAAASEDVDGPTVAERGRDARRARRGDAAREDWLRRVRRSAGDGRFRVVLQGGRQDDPRLDGEGDDGNEVRWRAAASSALRRPDTSECRRRSA